MWGGRQAGEASDTAMADATRALNHRQGARPTTYYQSSHWHVQLIDLHGALRFERAQATL